MKEVLENILDVSEENLNSRIEIIRTQLIDYAQVLRSTLQEQLPNNELIELPNFRNWVLINLILDNSFSDDDDDSFNRMLYFMYEKCNGIIVELISQYELDVIQKDDGGFSFDLKIIETEFTDE